MQRQPRFNHPATEELFQYWNRRRGARPAPDRSEIEPGDIRNILPDTFILEVDENRGYAWRLAGTRVCALHCRELKGRDFLGDWEGRERTTIQSLLEAVVKESAVGILQVEGRTERGQTVQLELVLMPLRVFGRPTCRVLGAIAALDVPYWVGMFPPVQRSVKAMRMVWPSGDVELPRGEAPPEPRARSVPVFRSAETPPPSMIKDATAARRYRHLMVLDGGKT